MSCDLADVLIEFQNSGVKIRPLGVDIHRSRQYKDQFDQVSAEITAKAGDHIQELYTPREPVIITANGAVLYYGYAQHDCVNHGRNRSNLTISDPRRLLREGIVDKEWSAVTLRRVAEYIFEQVPDPEGVLSGLEVTSPKMDTERLQFDDYENAGFADSNGPDYNWADITLQKIANLNRETIPLFNGDGNFDFREETPYSALLEVCDIWEVEMYMQPDGTLTIGLPSMDPTVNPVGLDGGMWRLVEYNIPENPTPLKGVYVKGGTITVPSDNDSNTATYSVVGDFEKVQTRAYSEFTDVDSEETLVVNARNTTEPKTLKEIARRKLINMVSKNNSGNIVIDILASDTPDNWVEGFGPGDLVAIFLEHVDCLDVRDGIYDVQAIQHDISADKGWSVTLEVSAAITNAGNIDTKFWHFDPTDPEMTQDGGAP